MADFTARLHIDMARYRDLAPEVRYAFDEWVNGEPITGAVEIFVRGSEATIVTTDGSVRQQELRTQPPENAMEISSFA